MKNLTITVCGCGNGAHACAAHMKTQGHTVNIYSPLSDEIERFKSAYNANGGMTMYFGSGLLNAKEDGIAEGSNVKTTKNIQLDCITDDPSKVIPGASFIFVIVPAFAHGNIMRHIKPFLSRNSVVVFMPSRSGLEFEVRSIMPEANVIALQTLPWATRLKTFGSEVVISTLKKCIRAASMPMDLSDIFFAQLQQVLEMEVVRVKHISTMTFANAGQIIHPGIMYSNFKKDPMKIYSAKDQPLFYQGVDDEGGERLGAMSREVISIAKAAAQFNPDIEVDEVLYIGDWIQASYRDDIKDHSSIGAMFRSNASYRALRAPMKKVGEDQYQVDFTARYITEDIPYGILVTKSIGMMLNVETPTIDEVLTALDLWTGNNYLGLMKTLKEFSHISRLPESYGISSPMDWYLATMPRMQR